MAYNSGIFSLFNQAQNYTNVFADLKAPTFAPPASFLYNSVYGKSIAPSILTTGTGTVRAAYGQQIAPSISGSGITVSTAYGFYVVGPNLTVGTLTTAYSLFSRAPSGAGTISNNYGAYFGLPATGTVLGGVGIGTTTPRNALDVNGALALGSYAGSVVLSSGTFAVSGSAGNPIVGVGTPSPQYLLDVAGTLSASYVYGLMPQAQNQLITLAEGYTQGGFGGGSVGTSKTMSAATSSTYNMGSGSFGNTQSKGFAGAVFDGRYIYYVPNNNISFSGQITRYDTTQPFNASVSYAIFNTTSINSLSKGFEGGIFDGRYVYLVPYANPTSSGQITRYDTAASFLSSSSYSVFNTATLQSLSLGFIGAVFDGHYIYFVPNNNGITASGQITSYDTTLPFGSSSSYAFFDTTAVNSASKGFFGGVYDGRYVYLIPNNNLTFFGQITRYDTSSSFTSASSYSVFDTRTINTFSVGFQGGVFDGRYVYLIPFRNLTSFSGQITRYDTTGSFTSSSNYSVFDTSILNTQSRGFFGAVFDGRYIYLTPNLNTNSGLVTRYDTTQSFSIGSSYSIFDTALSLTTLSSGFNGAVFDGRYVYLVPHQSRASFSGLVTRLDAYPGPAANAIAISQIPGSFAIGSFAGIANPSTNNLVVSGNVGIGTSSPQYLLDVNGAVSAQYIYGLMPQQPNQTITLAQGYDQGGFGGGSVGTQKTMSQNTTSTFDLSLVNSNGTGFSGNIFDGRYVYLIPKSRAGQIFRYDTTLPFGISTSYSFYDTRTNVSSSISTFSGGIFDGRYIYFAPSGNAIATRYDTTLPFAVATSYTVVSLSSVVTTGSAPALYNGAVFDGRYIYFVPASTALSNGTVVLYDTTASFTSSGSYSSFNTTTVQSNSRLFAGGTFDGRYVYFVPRSSGQTGQITRYDTTLAFGTSTSYSVFDTQTINGSSQQFWGAVFDGRFIYYVPNANGQITRFDTTGTFASASSYSVFNTATQLNSLSTNFVGGSFDGRYVYFFGNASAIVTRYDTSQSFLNISSYTLFSTNGSTSSGGVFDGRYLYTSPSGSVMVRLDAYSGPQVNAIATSAIPNSFAIGNYAWGTTTPNNSLIMSGGAGFGTSAPNYFVDVNGAVSAQYIYGLMPQQPNQTISLAEGYNQGGFGGGSVGTQKTMSANTYTTFDFTNLGVSATAYAGGAFDGRYVYYTPFNTSPYYFIRYDTTVPFGASSSYSIFSLSFLTVPINGKGTWFDGRYVYIGNNNNTKIVRYDTTQPFQLNSSYAEILLINVANAGIGPNYSSGIFDGRYIYFPPDSFSASNGNLVRYDTTSSFSSSTSYSVFNLTSVKSSAYKFNGGTFDGRYIYLTPTALSTAPGQIARYDTTLSFSSSLSYSFFDTRILNANSGPFNSAVFDGRFIYFIPNINPIVSRFDTFGSFTSASSYAFFDLTAMSTLAFTINVGTFDGRYVYFVGPFNGIVRYDTTQSFLNTTSYSLILGLGSLAQVNGCIFDGRYIYGISASSTSTFRMDAYPGPAASSLAVSQIPSSFAIGDYAGVTTPPANSLIASGGLGVGNTAPTYFADVLSGSVNATAVLGVMPQQPNQTISLAIGNNQGGFGSGAVGTQKTMSANTTVLFDTKVNLNSNSAGFQGSVFDGRYVYFIPSLGGTNSSQVTRYDTTIAFGSSASYAVFNLATVSTNTNGYSGAIFDGRYIYFVPYRSLLATFSTQITRYDTNSPFAIASSYSIFSAYSINTNCGGFRGAVFDGRYIYYVPNTNSLLTASGQILRYDTTASFVTASSYSIFNLATVSTASVGFIGGVYDGQYVYFVPSTNLAGPHGLLSRYDTSLSFSASASYSTYDTTAISAASQGFFGGVFDGRFIYLVPNNNGTAFGQITRFDTFGTFSSSSSYAVFDTTTVQSNSKGFSGGVFDGRYLYLVPTNNGANFGQVTRFDTSGSFIASGNYSTFDTATVNSLSIGFVGGLFDGRYVYLVPSVSNTFSGQITRLDGYPGSLASALAFSSNVSTSLAIGAYAGVNTPPTNGLIVSGSVGIGSADSSYALNVAGSLNANAVYGLMPQQNSQTITLAQGYNQGGFGGGSVGTNKKMSANTTVFLDMSTYVNSLSGSIFGSAFDGRYIYLVGSGGSTTNGGQITRYDTTSNFSSSTSYSIFNTTAVNSFSRNLKGALFDGRYVYIASSFNGRFMRYDTTLPFSASSSYEFFGIQANINSNCTGFTGGVFDGRYIYLTPTATSPANQNTIVRYDSTLPFSTPSSYAIFPTINVINSGAIYFQSATYDGRFVYFMPGLVTSPSTTSGTVLQYDTSLSFSSSNSYAIFDTVTNVNSGSRGFIGSVFDGRFIYYVPFSSYTLSGQITRYDTTGSFSSRSSYAVFDMTANFNSLCMGYENGVFDGRYVYYMPASVIIGSSVTNSGQVTRYDTTLPFTSPFSYSVFNTASLNSQSSSFSTGLFDGRYIYLIPGLTSGQITRMDAYQGPQATAISATQALNGFAVGSYVGVNTPPVGGLIVPGSVGVNNATPLAKLDVVGTVNAQTVYGYMPQVQNQLITLAEGYNQSGFGSGSVGTNRTMSQNTTAFFSLNGALNSASLRFNGAVFDGRYVYYVPVTQFFGGVLRYDSTLPFGVSTSYAFFDIAGLVNSFCSFFGGGIFDGQYVYFIPQLATPLFTRYDTRLPFSSSNSYAIMDLNTVASNNGFFGAIFDGRYIYLPSQANAATPNMNMRYDTTLPFKSTSSYAFFDINSIDSLGLLCNSGTYDGRYVYYVSSQSNPGGSFTPSGQLLRYDTTVSFTLSSSYAVFNVATLNSLARSFYGAVFDGRYVYMVPFYDFLVANRHGNLVRYDTTLPFSTSTSYAVFNTATIQSNSVRFQGGLFDGRYVYLIPTFNASGSIQGQVTRYDTTLPFSLSSSYAFFDTASTNANSTDFIGAVYDGRYIYLVPNNTTATKVITRLDAYPGPASTAMMAATQASNNFSLGTSLTNATTNGTASIGTFSVPATPKGYIVLTINGTTQKIPYYNL